MLQDEVGYPFDHIPTRAFTYGSGGFFGWGSLCGALSSAVAVINLFHGTETATKLSNELFAWYSQCEFPAYQPDMALPTTVADSVLCHVSITKFMGEAGVVRASKERKARCGGLTSDVAMFTVKMLNDEADGVFTPKYKPAAVVGECMSCHSTDSHGKDNCTPCHDDPHKEG
jgi:hypothetical protein